MKQKDRDEDNERLGEMDGTITWKEEKVNGKGNKRVPEKQ